MIKVDVDKEFQFEIDANAVENGIDMIKIDNNRYHIIKNNRSYDIEVLNQDNKSKNYTLLVNGTEYNVSLKDELAQLLDKMGMSAGASKKVKEIKAPMPGLVLDIHVEAGTEVKEGDAVLVLEAMKMENVIKSPADGIVKAIEISKGNAVEKNEILVSFE